LVIQAILNADLIVIGPGSLYTSILPNLLVPDIAAAIRANRGVKMYIANVASQPGETDGFSLGDHLHALIEHVGDDLFDLVICNQRFDGSLLPGMEWVRPEPESMTSHPVYQADLIAPDEPWHHDADKLAYVINEIYAARTGPLAG
jgi:uncharacterized cofD-like protein